MQETKGHISDKFLRQFYGHALFTETDEMFIVFAGEYNREGARLTRYEHKDKFATLEEATEFRDRMQERYFSTWQEWWITDEKGKEITP